MAFLPQPTKLLCEDMDDARLGDKHPHQPKKFFSKKRFSDECYRTLSSLGTAFIMRQLREIRSTVVKIRLVEGHIPDVTKCGQNIMKILLRSQFISDQSDNFDR